MHERRACALVAITAVLGFAMNCGTSFGNDNAEIFEDRTLVALTLASLNGPADPDVRFHNRTSSTEKYLAFGGSTCSSPPKETFAAVAQDDFTVGRRMNSFYLNINGTTCLPSLFSFATRATGLAPVLVTCTVTTTQVTCDDPGQTSVSR